MFPGRLTSRSTGWRLGVAAVAVGCLLGQVTAMAHQVLVRHATCAEHGESVHLGSVDADGVRQDDGVGQGAPRFADADAVNADAHDHCSVLMSRGLSPRSPHDQAMGPSPEFFDRGVLHQAVLGFVTRPYLIAPKTSPPRLAS